MMIFFITLTFLNSTLGASIEELCRGQTNLNLPQIYSPDQVSCDPQKDLLGYKTGSFIKDGVNIIDQLVSGPNQIKLNLALGNMKEASEKGMFIEAEDYIDVIQSSQFGQKLIECYNKAHPARPLEKAILPIHDHPLNDEFQEDPNSSPIGLWDSLDKNITEGRVFQNKILPLLD